MMPVRFIFILLLTFFAGFTTISSSQIVPPDAHSEFDIAGSNPTDGYDSTSPSRSHREPIERLTLGEAFDIAQHAHPDLAAAEADIQQAMGRQRQAGLFPNPALISRIEAAPFSGKTRDEAEYVFGVAQPIPLGNRLRVAWNIAQRERHYQFLQLEVFRLRIRTRIRHAFADVLYWQHIIAAWHQAVQIAQNGVQVAQARLDAGDTTPSEVAQTEIEVHRARLELEQAQSRSDQGIDVLLVSLGDPTLKIESLEGSLGDISLQAPTLDSLMQRLESSPHMAAAVAQIEVAQSRLDLAKERAKPDLDLELTYRRIGNMEDAVDLGVRVPIPLFDRNQGIIHSEQAALTAAEHRARSLRNEIELNLRNTHREIVRAIRTARLLREDIIPQSQSVLETLETRYSGGDINLLEILPLRRDFISLRIDYLDALRRVMGAWADLAPYLQEFSEGNYIH